MLFRKAIITTAEVSDGARHFAEALKDIGYTVQFRTLVQEAHTPTEADLHIDRSLPPYDLPIRDWANDGHTWWNRPDRAWEAWDKAVTAHACITHGIPVVPTIAFDRLNKEDSISGYIAEAERAKQIADLYAFPIVVKPTKRSVGEGVVLAHDLPALRYEMAHLGCGVLQPHLPEGTRTLRVVVAADTVISAYARTAAAGNWKANVGQGAKVEAVTLDPATEGYCRHLVRILGLNFAGVDVIETENGPVILEVNPAFGVIGLQEVTSGKGVRRVIDALFKSTVTRPRTSTARLLPGD